jgi:Eco29kI restriction endonuclease
VIARFKPVWNLALVGFGNHDPGANRYSDQRPVWDVLHPGRAWAERCAARVETPEGLATRVEEFLLKNPPPTDPHTRFIHPQSH